MYQNRRSTSRICLSATENLSAFKGADSVHEGENRTWHESRSLSPQKPAHTMPGEMSMHSEQSDSDMTGTLVYMSSWGRMPPREA